jgi:hypothetical protein
MAGGSLVVSQRNAGLRRGHRSGCKLLLRWWLWPLAGCVAGTLLRLSNYPLATARPLPWPSPWLAGFNAPAHDRVILHRNELSPCSRQQVVPAAFQTLVWGWSARARLLREQLKALEIALLTPLGAGINPAFVDQYIHRMEPGNLTPNFVVMRLYEFIQFINGETFRMRTHQAQNRFNGTVLLRKLTTIRHNSTSRTSIALPGRGDPWVWSLFSEKITDSRQTVDQTTARATRKGRHKQQMYQSQFLGSSIALESFSITAKILTSQTLPPITGRQQPDWKIHVHLYLRFSDFVPVVIIKLHASQATSLSTGEQGLRRSQIFLGAPLPPPSTL